MLFSITITGAPKLSAGIGLGNGVEFCQGSIGAIRSSLAMFTTSEHTQYTYKHPQYKATYCYPFASQKIMLIS